MRLLDHVSITVTDLARAGPFYEAVMASLGASRGYERQDATGFGQPGRHAQPADWPRLGLRSRLHCRPDGWGDWRRHDLARLDGDAVGERGLAEKQAQFT